MTTYGDIHIWSLDLAYIERLENEFDVDTWDAELYSLENWWVIANDIIYHIQVEAVNGLDIPQKYKDVLLENIYTNCIDSGFNVNIEDFPKKYRETIENFISLF